MNRSILFCLAMYIVACGEKVNFADKSEPHSQAGAAMRNIQAPINEQSADVSPIADRHERSSTASLYAAEKKQDRIIIKNGSLQIQVQNYDETVSKLRTMVTAWGGFVAHSSTSVPYADVKEGNWTIRIPSEHFDTAMTGVKTLGQKTERESVEGQDITEEFYDLEARLRNKRLEEEQVQAILRRAGTISDVLEVQRELNRIREEIERAEGRKQLLSDRVKYSTINIQMHEAYPVTVSANGGFWATIAEGFADGFKGFANVLSGTITVLIAGIPVFIVFGLVIRFVFLRMRRHRENPKTFG
ncbi:MAG TPA: DUF4349 domain-containing protein [bacterium]|nr:DUF4349 domain-containing protein [bacterium]HNF87293.1 DUF4349 domain-containing protein [bacterium]HNO91664.1 DUF4349 domain-containing protein [bacterium]